MKIGVGVVTYNNEPLDLKRFLLSFDLAAQTIENSHEVALLFIDNGAPSGMETMREGTIMLPPVGNIGYTKAINLLMKKAFDEEKVDAFICANPDGAFHYKAIGELIAHSQRFPDSLIEGMQFPEEHPKIYDTATYETDWASGCCLFITRKLYETIGVFDEHFFMYMEDVDFSWRACSAGFTIRICPSALFAHAVIGREPNRKTSQYFLESGRYLAAKWGDATFKSACEKQLLDEQFYSSVENLPSLPDVTFEKTENHTVPCFNKNFSFAEVRW